MKAVIGWPNQIEATLTESGWTCETETLQTALNLRFPYPPAEGEDAAYDPNPFATVARSAAEALGATVLSLDTPKRDEGKIY